MARLFVSTRCFSHASRIVREGISLSFLREDPSHSSVKFRLRTYGHATCPRCSAAIGMCLVPLFIHARFLLNLPNFPTSDGTPKLLRWKWEERMELTAEECGAVTWSSHNRRGLSPQIRWSWRLLLPRKSFLHRQFLTCWFKWTTKNSILKWLQNQSSQCNTREVIR